MVRTLSIHETSVGVLINAIETGDEPIIVMEPRGTPCLVVMSPQEYDRLLGDRSQRTWEMIQRVQEQSVDKDFDEIMRDVTREVEAVRQKLYEKKRAEHEDDR